MPPSIEGAIDLFTAVRAKCGVVAEEDALAVRPPIEDAVAGGVVGEARRHAAVGVHDVDVVSAVVLGAEGDFEAVGGEFCVEFGTGVVGDASGGAAGGGDDPEVVFVGEDDFVVVDVGDAHEVVCGGFVGGCRLEQGGERQEGGGSQGFAEHEWLCPFVAVCVMSV